MAKLVRRHTSNVEIIGSNPIGSIFFMYSKYANDTAVIVSMISTLLFFFNLTILTSGPATVHLFNDWKRKSFYL